MTDSVQLGDRPAWDKTLGNFGNLNEPHYRCGQGNIKIKVKVKFQKSTYKYI